MTLKSSPSIRMAPDRAYPSQLHPQPTFTSASIACDILSGRCSTLFLFQQGLQSLSSRNEFKLIELYNHTSHFVLYFSSVHKIIIFNVHNIPPHPTYLLSFSLHIIIPFFLFSYHALFPTSTTPLTFPIVACFIHFCPTV